MLRPKTKKKKKKAEETFQDTAMGKNFLRRKKNQNHRKQKQKYINGIILN
jgi:hypothetical protein